MTEDPAKIVIDEDWKAQVEKEKQLATEVTSNEPSAKVDPFPAPPAASFETLVSMLFTQGMAALGQVHGEDNQPLPVNKPFAKHFIDTIEMLGERTTGNLSEQESTMLSEVLHALRMAFVTVKAPK